MNPEPHDEQELELPQRPRTRGECIGGERPCPWVSCRYHLYLDVQSRNGSNGSGHVQINAPGEPWELTESCSLDVAERGEQTLEVVGGFLHITRERIRQIEAKALKHTHARMKHMQVDGELRAAIAGDRHRPELNDASQSTVNVPKFSKAEQAKLHAVKPDVTVYRREKGSVKKNATKKNPLASLPRNPVAGDIAREVWTNIKTNTKESIMATTKFTEEDKQRTIAAQEEIAARRQNGWSLSGIGRAIGKSISYLSAINAGRDRCTRDIYEKIQALPTSPSEKPAKAPAKNPPQAKAAPTVPAPQTAEVTVQWSTALSPALARLDKEITETEQRLSILRDLRTKWAGAEA